MKSAKKSPGRPPKPKEERRSHNRTFRVRGHLDRAMKEAAARSGRSISEEIEARLERSFYLDDTLVAFMGKRGQIIRALSATVLLAENITASMGPIDAFPVLKIACGYVLDFFVGKPIPKDEEIQAELSSGEIDRLGAEYKFIGQTIAATVLQNLGLIAPIVKYGEITEILRAGSPSRKLSKETDT